MDLIFPAGHMCSAGNIKSIQYSPQSTFHLRGMLKIFKFGQKDKINYLSTNSKMSETSEQSFSVYKDSVKYGIFREDPDNPAGSLVMFRPAAFSKHF